MLLEPEDRAEPFCPYFGTCGGCTLQHLGPASYAALKTEQVERALRDAHVTARIAPLIEAHGDGRRRATLHARGKAVGYMQMRSHELLVIAACPILVPALQQRAVSLSHPIAATIGDCDIAITASDTGLDVAIRSDKRLKAERLTLLAQRAKLARMSLNGEIVLEERAPAIRMGKALVELPIGSFLQATAMAEAVLARLVAEGVGPAKSVADLFCGLGPFSLRLAERAGPRVGEVESRDRGRRVLRAKNLCPRRRDPRGGRLSARDGDARRPVCLVGPRRNGRGVPQVTPKPSVSHLALGPEFYDPVEPAAFPELTLRYRNQRAAGSIGIDGWNDTEWVDHFGRFTPIAGSFETPLALRYHGHQFQTYNPDLGDGRGFLFAQLHDADGRLLDLGTKGSGQTPWSRMGDGRLTLKGGIREVLATAMLEALGVDTSKSLSLIETGEELERHDEPSPTRAGALVRLSHSHVRIGTFQRLSYLGDTASLNKLLAYSLRTYFGIEGGNAPAETLLRLTAERVASTGADWIAAGFVHGVLNSDNINITGESFDYGPWRFAPTYDPNFTAAYFDQTGLYAFGRQPEALVWNLHRFAECLLPLGEHAGIEAALNSFWPAFRQSMWAAVLRRLGLVSRGDEADSELVIAIFAFLNETQMPYERFWFDWRGGLLSDGRASDSPYADGYRTDAFTPIRGAFGEYEPTPSVNLDHPYFARPVPRTMLIEEMEALWAPIAEHDDWSDFHRALGEIEEMREAYAGDTKSGIRSGIMS